MGFLEGGEWGAESAYYSVPCILEAENGIRRRLEYDEIMKRIGCFLHQSSLFIKEATD